MQRLSLSLLLLTIHIGYSTETSCVFEFPTLSGSSVLTAKANATVSLPFRFQDGSCNKTDKHVFIMVMKKTGGHTRLFCRLHINFGFCSSQTSTKCSCLPQRNHFHLKMRVNRVGNGTSLLFGSEFGKLKEVEINFNVISPPPKQPQQLYVTPGHNAEVKFPVISYTTSYKGCRMIRNLSIPVDQSRQPGNTARSRDSLTTVNCTSFVNLTGTPPDLTLTVRLDNVRKEEEGQWRLELTNDEGTEVFYFFLHMAEKNRHESLPEVKVVAGVASAVLLVITILVLTLFVCTRRGCRSRKRRSILEEGKSDGGMSSTESVYHISNICMEIRDELVPEAYVTNCSSTDPYQPAHREPPDDFPVVSRDVKKGTESSTNAVILFDNSVLRPLHTLPALPASQRRVNSLPIERLTSATAHDVEVGTATARNVVSLYDSSILRPADLYLLNVGNKGEKQ